MTTERPDPAALLPCPWCGGPPSVCEDDSYGACSIICGSCDTGPEAAHRKKEELAQAIAAWNTRAAPTPQAPTHTADDAAVLADKYASKNWSGDDYTASFDSFIAGYQAAVLARMSTPPGYKLVPVEPTDGMMRAVAEADALAPTRVSGNPFALFKRLWLAAVAAAPTEVK